MLYQLKSFEPFQAPPILEALFFLVVCWFAVEDQLISTVVSTDVRSQDPPDDLQRGGLAACPFR